MFFYSCSIINSTTEDTFLKRVFSEFLKNIRKYILGTGRFIASRTHNYVDVGITITRLQRVKHTRFLYVYLDPLLQSVLFRWEDQDCCWVPLVQEGDDFLCDDELSLLSSVRKEWQWREKTRILYCHDILKRTVNNINNIKKKYTFANNDVLEIAQHFKDWRLLWQSPYCW